MLQSLLPVIVMSSEAVFNFKLNVYYTPFIFRGCMFTVHSEVSLVELILLGVKAGLKKKGIGFASILKLKEFYQANGL